MARTNRKLRAYKSKRSSQRTLPAPERRHIPFTDVDEAFFKSGETLAPEPDVTEPEQVPAPIADPEAERRRRRLRVTVGVMLSPALALSLVVAGSWLFGS